MVDTVEGGGQVKKRQETDFAIVETREDIRENF